MKEKDNKQILIIAKIKEYDELEVDDGLIYIKLNDDGENIIDKEMNRLVQFIYDDLGRCIENRIFNKAFNYDFNGDSEQPLLYSYLSSVYHSYLGDQPYPFRSKTEKFWVANKFDKGNNLIQSVTSKGSTLQQKFKNDALIQKKFRIKQDDETIKDYVFTFEMDRQNHFVEYQDSDGNFWNEALGFDCPFENPVQIKINFKDNNEFL
tara:strand:+ start:1251 stop:1871 length:621 start_codon:yes stop_codon:yes gene_type:complete